MTEEEQRLLEAYLVHSGEIAGESEFDHWYRETRTPDEDGEAEYEAVLAEAKAFALGWKVATAAAEPAGPTPDRHYHVIGYRSPKAPNRRINLVPVTLTDGYSSRRAANLAAGRLGESVTRVWLCEGGSCSMVTAGRRQGGASPGEKSGR